LLEWSGPDLHASSTVDALRIAGLTAVLSNLVCDVPAVMLMQPPLKHLGSTASRWSQLALASTLAGNLTLIGSVANLIVAEKAHREGIHLGFWAYLAVGVPLTIASMAIGAV
jgi:Na+/H+ antiporter NhaD/arsenite permease-like protein